MWLLYPSYRRRFLLFSVVSHAMGCIKRFTPLCKKLKVPWQQPLTLQVEQMPKMADNRIVNYFLHPERDKVSSKIPEWKDCFSARAHVTLFKSRAVSICFCAFCHEILLSARASTVSPWRTTSFVQGKQVLRVLNEIFELERSVLELDAGAF